MNFRINAHTLLSLRHIGETRPSKAAMDKAEAEMNRLRYANLEMLLLLPDADLMRLLSAARLLWAHERAARATELYFLGVHDTQPQGRQRKDYRHARRVKALFTAEIEKRVKEHERATRALQIALEEKA